MRNEQIKKDLLIQRALDRLLTIDKILKELEKKK